jgi:hypothetical protein
MKTQALLPLLALLATLQVQAGPGHDHGDEAPKASGVALPRFAASSDLFELVGVLEGKTLTLYLDRAASNEPVPQAELELELLGAKLSPKAQADGSFVVELAKAPGDGVHAVTATVSVGDESDLLAGELDLHGEAHDDHAHEPRNGRVWGVLGLSLLVGAGFALIRRRRNGSAA